MTSNPPIHHFRPYDQPPTHVTAMNAHQDGIPRTIITTFSEPLGMPIPWHEWQDALVEDPPAPRPRRPAQARRPRHLRKAHPGAARRQRVQPHDRNHLRSRPGPDPRPERRHQDPARRNQQTPRHHPGDPLHTRQAVTRNPSPRSRRYNPHSQPTQNRPRGLHP